MAIFHAGRLRAHALGGFLQNGRVDQNIFFSEQRAQLLRRHGARAQNGQLVSLRPHHGGFHAIVAVPPAYDCVRAAVQIADDMRRGRGAGLARKIGRGRRYGYPALQNQLGGDRVGGKTDADGIQPAGH